MSTIVQTMRTLRLHKVLILITVLLFGVVLALNDANDLILTAAEKNALDQVISTSSKFQNKQQILNLIF